MRGLQDRGMRVAFVVYGLPDRETNGAPMVSYAIVRHLAEAGHRVTVCSLIEKGNPDWNVERARVLLGGSGIGLELVEGGMQQTSQDAGLSLPRIGRRLRWTVSPDLASLFPKAAYGPLLWPILDSIQPDAMVLYHWEALAATYGYTRKLPRLAVTGDPAHLPAYYRWRLTPLALTADYLKRALWVLHASIHMPRYMRKMLAACDFKGQLAAHHAEWLRTHGAPDCVYLRMPIVDEAGPDWQTKRQKARPNGKPKILMIGDVMGTASLAGLRLFAEEVLPRLEESLGPDGFEVHIVGRGQPPAEVATRLARPAVRLRGRVESAAPEFESADVLLIPTPIPLGVRTRAIVAFSYGCCVVAHSANAQGLPEMAHEHNALLASSGHGLAKTILRSLHDPALRQRLGANGRKTYEDNFHPSVAAGRIASELDRSPISRSEVMQARYEQ